eukprot:scaffold37025_cov77-Phaeocystis_antarctica.AAC.2
MGAYYGCMMFILYITLRLYLSNSPLTSYGWSGSQKLPPGGDTRRWRQDGARGGARNPLQQPPRTSALVRGVGPTAQSALGWYRPSVGVPETLDGKPSGVLV